MENIEELIDQLNEKEKQEKKRDKNTLKTGDTTSNRRFWWLMSAAVPVVALLVVVFMDSIFMPSFVDRDVAIPLPSIVGQPAEQAMETLERLDVTPVVTGEQFSAEVEQGHIISQDPAAGIEVKPGRQIRLIISSGQNMVQLPNLVGKSLRESKILLLGMGLQVGDIQFAYSEKNIKDVVEKQSPAPGTELNKQSIVNLHVSLGSEQRLVEVPDLSGFTEDEAKTVLSEHELQPEIQLFSDETFMSGFVMGQSPTPGDSVEAGSTVTIMVNQ